MNLALFKREIKSNYKVFIIIFAVLLMYTSVVTSLFDPNLGSILEQFSQTMPELMSAFGMTSPGSTLLNFYHLIYTALFISSSHSFLKSLLRISWLPATSIADQWPTYYPHP